ncbi:uncharacterized protein LOC120648744 isoform X2 [Panicum virgatum]|uniref:uncharacterized protein LOC120648744 isoform X2 n=1 Tax=Panicum virgatum TaxID=38727 RepID=UPI0019D4F11D|nr:uncharacterized protein LOC120648744 isoform X2 [Panicum virgatum]
MAGLLEALAPYLPKAAAAALAASSSTGRLLLDRAALGSAHTAHASAAMRAALRAADHAAAAQRAAEHAAACASRAATSRALRPQHGGASDPATLAPPRIASPAATHSGEDDYLCSSDALGSEAIAAVGFGVDLASPEFLLAPWDEILLPPWEPSEMSIRDMLRGDTAAAVRPGERYGQLYPPSCSPLPPHFASSSPLVVPTAAAARIAADISTCPDPSSLHDPIGASAARATLIAGSRVGYPWSSRHMPTGTAGFGEEVKPPGISRFERKQDLYAKTQEKVLEHVEKLAELSDQLKQKPSWGTFVVFGRKIDVLTILRFFGIWF